MSNWDVTQDGLVLRDGIVVACQQGIVGPLTVQETNYALGLIDEYHRSKVVAAAPNQSARSIQEIELRIGPNTFADVDKLFEKVRFPSHETVRASLVGTIEEFDALEPEDVAGLADELMHALSRLGVIRRYGDTQPETEIVSEGAGQ